MLRLLRWSLIAGLFSLGVARAAGCNLVAQPTLESMANDTQVVVVATVSGAGEDTATLEVEQYLKGGDGAREISLVNHEFGIDPSCDPLIGPGARWSDGTRLLAFLNPATADLGADWQDGVLGGMGIIVINDDSIILPSGELLPLADALTRISGQAPADDPAQAPAILPAPPPGKPAPGIKPMPAPDQGLIPVPQPTVAPEPEATAASETRAKVIPWVLLAVGAASGLGALVGLLRSRRQQE
jgi:hypothetical protein